MKTAKDVMVDVFDYPHIPYWFTIRQAMGIVRKSLLSGDKCHHPMAVLVFDEKYNLMGTLGLKDLLKGAEPKFLQPVAKAQVPDEDESGLAALWDTFFTTESAELTNRPVSEVMVPAKYFVQPGDPLTKAAYLMVHHDLMLLPVLEDKKKFVGLVRMIEVFDELSDALLNA
jgi:CBS-domain-containing membrane protein